MKRATKEVMFSYLDELRDSGLINMFGARPHLMAEFGIPPARALEVLREWMRVPRAGATR